MIGFFLKKNFFDGWDNFLPLALFNSAVILIVFLFFGLAYAVSAAPALPELILFVCLIVIGVLLLAVSHLMSRIADYTHVEAWRFICHTRNVLLDCCGSFRSLLFFISKFSRPFSRCYRCVDFCGYTAVAFMVLSDTE